MNFQKIPLVLILLLALLLASCAASPAGQSDLNPTDDKSAPEPAKTEIDQEVPEATIIPRIEPVMGEVPDEILDEIIADLVERTGSEQDGIQVIRAETVVWNDGSLGCPKAGEFYIQVLIDGFWVVLEVEGVEYDYRVSDKGSFRLCEGEDMSPIIPPAPGQESQNSLVEQAKDDLAERPGIETDDIELLSFEEVVWPDASLGCPQPGMRYKRVPYDGALIRLSAGGQVYDFHSGGSRGVFLCEQALKVKPTTPKIDISKHTPPPRDTEDQ